MKRFATLTLAATGMAGLAACSDAVDSTAPAAAPSAAVEGGHQSTGVNVLLRSEPTEAMLAELKKIGPVLDVLPQIDAVTMRASARELDAIRAKPFVIAAEVDGEVEEIPVDATAASSDFSGGRSTWALDALNITTGPASAGRSAGVEGLTGEGVYVAILDTGLLPSWRSYFKAERVATQYARAFGGGAGVAGTVSEQPDKWERDVDAHGTHVASSILGFSYPNAEFNGAAPAATVIPVKVLNQNGSGWWSAIARGIIYVGDLKAGALADSPVVINMSLGGGRSLVMEEAIDYAIAQGVIVVASAGNSGAAGMGHPGSYAPVISVASGGYAQQFRPCAAGQASVFVSWWNACDVPDAASTPTTSASDLFISAFSAREKAGQDLDVVGPGHQVVGPYQTNQGQLGWFFLNGTSMSSPHVAGVVALMAEKHHALTATQAETILENTAVPMGKDTRQVYERSAGRVVTYSWDVDATGSGFVDAVAAIKATP